MEPMTRLAQPPSAEFLPSGRVTLRGFTMKALLQLAFKEIDSDRFDLVAKAPAGTLPEAAQPWWWTSAAPSSRNPRVHNLTMGHLAERLPEYAPLYIDRPVLDLTELERRQSMPIVVIDKVDHVPAEN